MTDSLRARRIRRWTIRAGIALLAAYVLYLVAGNAFLNLDAAQSLLNRKPEKFQIAWDGGHTLLPGRVALRDVRMRGHARRTAWTARAERASGRIAVLPLLRREIRIPWVQAEVVTGSVGRADSDLPPPESRPGGWTLRMDRIASDSIEGGEVFDWTLAGKGVAEVGFSKQFRGGAVELLPSSAAFTALSASRDGETWLRDARLASTFSLASHLSPDYPGLRKLELFAVTLELEAKAIAMRYQLGDDDRYRFAAIPGEGSIEAKLSLARGALGHGDRLRLAVPLHAIDADGSEYRNTLDVGLDVDDGLRLRVLLPDRGARWMTIDADLRLPGNALPLGDWHARLAKASGYARGQLRVPSIGGLMALFAQADWLALQGSGRVEADLTLADGRLATGSRLRVTEMDAHADALGSRFSGRATAEAAIEAAADGTPRSRVDVVMQRFTAAPAGASAPPWITGNDLRVQLAADAHLEHMRDTLQARIRFRDARVPDLTVFNPYLPNDKLRFASGSGRLSGDLRVDGDGEVGEGTLRVDAQRARLAVAGLDLRGDVVLDGRLRRGSLQQGEFDLGGTQLRVRNAAFSERGGVARSGWWATLDLEGGHVAWKQPSTMGGRLRARMKDVDFLLAMFADRADYPAWISRVVDAGEARVDGRWLWQGNALVLDRVRASNDRFQIDARMRLQGEDRRGDLYAKWGVLGVGVELQGTQHKLHLRNARQWYDGRPHLLR